MITKTSRLWKVSVPVVSPDLEKTLSNLIRDDKDRLSATDSISGVFAHSPNPKHVHIVVVLPPPPGECLSCWLAVRHNLNSLNLASDHLTLECCVYRRDASHVFPVEIAWATTVGALKDAIKDKRKPEFDDVAADSLDLWVVSAF
jgi:Crinkler effector protein N-terminal domain